MDNQGSMKCPTSGSITKKSASVWPANGQPGSTAAASSTGPIAESIERCVVERFHCRMESAGAYKPDQAIACVLALKTRGTTAVAKGVPTASNTAPRPMAVEVYQPPVKALETMWHVGSAVIEPCTDAMRERQTLVDLMLHSMQRKAFSRVQQKVYCVKSADFCRTPEPISECTALRVRLTTITWAKI